MAAVLKWEAEPPSVASVGLTAMDQFRRPTSVLCDPTWADAAYVRIRDLEDWQQRMVRLSSMMHGGKGRGKGKAKEDPLIDGEPPGGQNTPKGPGERAPGARKAKAKES